MDADWLPSHPTRSKPTLQGAAGRVDAHCHVFGPGDEFPVRAGAQVHARATRRRSSSSRCATTSASPATSSCRRPATAPTTARWSMRCAIRSGRARGVATVDRERHRRASCTTLHDAGVRGVRFNFVKRLVDFTPARRADGHRRAHRAARLARGDLLRGAGPAGAVGLLHRAADHRGGRPHGPPRRAASRSTARSSSAS